MSKRRLSLGIIPARAHSTRFPLKVLAPILGKPMLQHVWEAAQKSSLERVIIATDDERIATRVRSFGAEVVLTPELPSGTDRVAWVAREIPSEVIVNIQGDEPLLRSSMINQLLDSLEDNSAAQMATLAVRKTSFSDFRNPNVVKVVVDPKGRALYFSRAPLLSDTEGGFLKHIGIYAFRRDTLLRFCALSPTLLERSERLEQLRALENGIPIFVVRVPEDTIAVDCPEDIAKVERAFVELCP